MDGAWPPAWDVEKKSGSMTSKSPSSSILRTRTEPTMPRQPMMPTFIVFKFTATRLDSQQMVPHFSPWKDGTDEPSARHE